MHSNGVIHLSNDTFFAVTREDPENAFLVTGSVTAERVTPFPLARPVRFFPCSAPGGADGESASGGGRHSLLSSPDGKFVVAVSATRRHHFLVNILAARVCEFETRALVVSAAWHPSRAAPVLLLLFDTGAVTFVRVEESRLGVDFIDLRRSSNVRAMVDELRDSLCGADDAIPSRLRAREPAEKTEKNGRAEETHSAAFSHPHALVSMAVVAATRSLPPLALFMTRSGDIFTVKLGPFGLFAPVASTRVAGAPPDEKKNQTNNKYKTSSSRKKKEESAEEAAEPCAHYLVRGDDDNDNEKDNANANVAALALGAALLDADVGRHAVFALFSPGALRGWWLSEPDLLVRDLRRRRADFAVALAPGARALQTCGNATLAVGGGETFLCVWPQWARRAAKWTFRRDAHDGAARAPAAGNTAAIPAPVVVRVPYAVDGASIAVGVNDLVIFPETKAGAARVVVAKIANLLLAAQYAAGERFVLTPGERRNSDSDSDAALEEMLNTTADCCRQWICGFPHDVIDESTAKLAQCVEDMHAETRRRQIALDEREKRLALRVEKLTRAHDKLAANTAESQSIVCEAIVHRRGPEMIFKANDQLGKIHQMLKELETIAAQRNDHSNVPMIEAREERKRGT